MSENAIKIYKSSEPVMPEEIFNSYLEKIIIDESLNIQKISPKSFSDFSDNYSESFQDGAIYSELFLKDYRLGLHSVQIGPTFYLKNWNNLEFLELLQDHLVNVEKELIFFVLESDSKGSISAYGETFYLEPNHIVAIKCSDLSEITAKNIENTKFLCSWKRYA